VDLKLANVDTSCTRIFADENGSYTGSETVPGPEVSADVGTLKLTNKKELFFLMDGKQARELSPEINASPATSRAGDGSCAVSVAGDLTRKM
jgi:hypothetical protein